MRTVGAEGDVLARLMDTHPTPANPLERRRAVARVVRKVTLLEHVNRVGAGDLPKALAHHQRLQSMRNPLPID